MGRRDFFEERKLRRLFLVFCITLAISIIAFFSIFVLYNRKLKENSSNELLELGQLNDIVPNDELEQLEETSSTSDKDISATNNNTSKSTSKKSSSKTDNKTPDNKTSVSSVVENITNTDSEKVFQNTVLNQVSNENLTNTVETPEIKQEMSFMAPVSGEIMKDFAIDTLIYSNTLEEWTTHSGIDIRAEKTTVVVASETGVIESIKTDPRYGLTITMTHSNGYKTIYSNLLTTEFVSEGETVEKGQTIATVGETSSFEIADESHLHFEMYKDGTAVNPTIYLKDI